MICIAWWQIVAFFLLNAWIVFCVLFAGYVVIKEDKEKNG